jgi:hypothetical protein
MESLPILVPVVAGMITVPILTLCCCMSALRRRVVAIEENMQMISDRAAASAPQNAFLGGVTYCVAPSAPSAHPYFTPIPPLGRQTV